MKSLLFVFAGLPANGFIPDLFELGKNIETRASATGIQIKLEKSKTLHGRLADVGYYIAFMESKNELKDWYKMAEDFELMLERKPITKSELIKRYIDLSEQSTNRYSDLHFKLGEIIFEEMEKLSGIAIYTFQ